MKAPTKDSVGVIQLSVYNRPSFGEKLINGKRWIQRGKDNLFFTYLIDLYNQSNTHGAVIDGKISYMGGRGLYVENENASIYEVARCQQFLEKPNPYETWDDIKKKIDTDYEFFNGYALEILENNVGNPVQVYHIAFDRLAIDRNDSSIYLYSLDWESKFSLPEKRIQNYNPTVVEIPKFEKGKKQPRSLIVHVEPRPGQLSYPLPSYINGIEAIEEEIEISQFHLNNVKNGFVGGTMINFLNGVPDNDIKAKIEETFNEKFTGGTGKKVLYNFADGKDTAAEVLPLQPNTLDKQFEARAKQVPENIIVAHRGVSGMLFGIKTEGQLGGRTEVLESYELFKETYIKPRQDTVLKTINFIFEVFGYQPLVKIKELQPLANILPITENNIMQLIPREVLTEYVSKMYGLTLPKVAPVQMSKPFYFANCGVNAADYEELEAHDVTFSEDGSVKFQYEDNGTELEFAEEGETDPKTGLIVPKFKPKTSPKAEISPIIIKYRYALRPDAPALLTESREFCQQMMNLNRLYTRQEIEGMKNDMDNFDIINNSDVWKYRGGWYRDPNKEVAVPFCRHTWKQVLVKQK